MTFTLNFIDQANENPFVDSNITESNAGSSQVTAAGYLQQITNGTKNRIGYSGTFDKAQSLQVTIQGKDSTTDLWMPDAAVDMYLLYQDASNHVKVTAASGGTNAKRFDISRVVGGTTTGIGSLTGLADTYLSAGDTLKFEAQWTGDNATFVLSRNGTPILTSSVQSSFSLTSGSPQYNLQRNSSGRCSSIRSITFTGESSVATPVISSGTPTGTTTATPTLGFTTDTNSGTARVVLSTVEADLDAVTGAQVLAGQDETGAAADAATGVLTVSTTTPTGTLGSTLPTGTYYAAAAQLKDGQYSNVLRWSFTVPPNPGLRLELRDTDTGALQGSLTNVDFAVRYTNQSEASIVKSTTATTDENGILVIDSDALGSVGDTVWISGKHSSGRTFAREVLVVDLNNPSSMSD